MSDVLIQCPALKLRGVNCMRGHFIILPLILHDVRSIQLSSGNLECQRLFKRLVARAQISLFYFGMVVTKLDNTSCNWYDS